MSHEPCLRHYFTRDEVSALLRASELANLRVSDLDLRAGTIYCRLHAELHCVADRLVLIVEVREGGSTIRDGRS